MEIMKNEKLVRPVIPKTFLCFRLCKRMLSFDGLLGGGLFLQVIPVGNALLVSEISLTHFPVGNALLVSEISLTHFP